MHPWYFTVDKTYMFHMQLWKINFPWKNIILKVLDFQADYLLIEFNII
jgi:hypothetical protein